MFLQKNVPLVNITKRKQNSAVLAVMAPTNHEKALSLAWPAQGDRLPELLKPYRLRNAGMTVLQVTIPRPTLSTTGKV